MSIKEKRESPKDPLEDIVADLLQEICPYQREELEATPLRVAKALRFLTSGYQIDTEKTLKKAVFEEPYSEMVVVKGIEFYSLCEHHLLPFFGKCHVGYIPKNRIVGLSKLPRIVNAFSRRLQVQERLTVQIAESLQHSLDPLGVGVVIEAKHLCMQMRGVQKENAAAITSCLLGGMRHNAKTREEFLRLINSPRGE